MKSDLVSVNDICAVCGRAPADPLVHPALGACCASCHDDIALATAVEEVLSASVFLGSLRTEQRLVRVGAAAVGLGKPWPAGLWAHIAVLRRETGDVAGAARASQAAVATGFELNARPGEPVLGWNAYVWERVWLAEQAPADAAAVGDVVEALEQANAVVERRLSPAPALRDAVLRVLRLAGGGQVGRWIARLQRLECGEVGALPKGRRERAFLRGLAAGQALAHAADTADVQAIRPLLSGTIKSRILRYAEAAVAARDGDVSRARHLYGGLRDRYVRVRVPVPVLALAALDTLEGRDPWPRLARVLDDSTQGHVLRWGIAEAVHLALGRTNVRQRHAASRWTRLARFGFATRGVRLDPAFVAAGDLDAAVRTVGFEPESPFPLLVVSG